MNVEYVNPFVTATTSVFKTMLSCPLTRGPLCFSEGSCPEHEVSGLIGLTGDATGLVVLSIDREVALCAAEVMLGERASGITADVVDMVGELANMIAGAAKAKLEKFDLHVTLPSVIVGRNHAIGFPSKARPIRIPFDSPWGPMCLEVSLEETPQAVAAVG